MARNKFDVDENLETPFNAKHLKRALKYVKRYKWPMIVSLLLCLVSNAAGLIGPMFTQKVIDVAIPQKSFSMLWHLAILYVGVIVINIVSDVIRKKLTTTACEKIVYDIRSDLFEHLQRLPFSYYDSRPAGKILVRVINYVNSVGSIMSNGIVTTILNLTNLVIVAVYMYMLDPKLATIVVAGLPVFVAVIFIIKPKQRKCWQNVSNKNSNFNAYLAESIDGARVSQLFTRQETNCSILERLASACRKSTLGAVYISNTVWLTSTIMTQVVFTALYLVGCKSAGAAMVSFGVVLAMSQYVSRFWDPVTNLANQYNDLVNNMAYMERIFEAMDEPVTVDNAPDAVEMPEITGEVEYRDVTFGYEEGQTVLEHVNLHVMPGESIALVGPTGAGKSTVVNLLSRFYNLNGGSIILHGVDGKEYDISKVTIHSLRSQMGIMLQDSFIFAGTIKSNILYGNLNATEEEVEKAADIVRADQFIQEMPMKYDTPVNERGGRLSQGQKQLIAFARTLVSDPKILVLDEATSSIDTKTERLLQQGLNAMLVGRTSFIIAHRLSTIKNCDRILYISNKGITESGSHDELMAKHGAYYKLYTAQSRDQGFEIADD